jgi:demethylmenaquinone methyltransferase/2-methoxy-6-polyprenyl-1,4-benzoquinol methylase
VKVDRPAGTARSERLQRRPEAIRAMFAGVARRYDLLNHVLSLRRDVAWRRRLAASVDSASEGPVLDIATGTGDVALALRGTVVGADFCLDMLVLARRKAAGAGRRILWVAADALALPFREGVFAAVTVAFGVRNFADLGAGLAEMSRVLAGGGTLAVLEFQRPRAAPMRALAAAWDRCVVVPVGRLISDDGAAYRYLPASVGTFPSAVGLGERLGERGFERVATSTLTGGIAALTVAQKRGQR